MKFSSLLTIGIAVVLLAQPLLVAPVFAQTPYRGVVVRLPATAERYLQISLNPGEHYAGSFIVQHEYQDSNKKVQLYIYASDFIYDNNDETVSYPDDSLSVGGSYSLSKWVKFDRSELVLDHYGQEETINFTVDVPAAATAGARYANIIVSNSPPLSEEQKQKLTENIDGAAIVTRLVVTTMLITVSGDRQQNVYLEDLRMTDGNGNAGLFGTNLFEFHPVEVKFKLRNMGNQVLLPGGDLFVHGGDVTDPIYKAEVNPFHERLLPNSQRTFTVEWNESSFKIGKDGFVNIDLVHFFNFNWGHYYAQVNVLYRDLNGKLAVEPGTVDFWVLPWKPLAIILLLSGIYGGYVMYKRRSDVKFITREDQEKMANSRRSKFFKGLRNSVGSFFGSVSKPSRPKRSKAK